MNKIALIALDIRSTYNVGSLFRTCDGFGAQLALVGITPHPMYPNDKRLPHIASKAHKTIAKTALGAENSVTWQYFPTLKECISFYKSKGYRTIAIEQDSKSKNIYELNSSDKTAIIVGPEVTGITSDHLALMDEIYEIPMLGSKESFNVSVAAGIALYQLQKQFMVK